MNDVEHDLRELFERKASSVGGVAPRLPEPVRKRGRRRQLGTAFVSGLTVLAVLAGTVGVIRAVDTGRDRQPTPADDPWAGYEVFERTATVGNFTITSPSDWYLVNQWPWARTLATDLQEQRERDVEACGEEPTQDERQACRSSLMGVPGDGWVAPILMLSDTDRGLESSPCFDRSFSIGSEDAVMTIALDSLFMAANFGAGDRAQWPVPFDTPPAEERQSCGPGTYVFFASGDIPYVAHFAFGDAVPEDERQTLIDAFEGMQVDDSQEVFMDEPKPDDAATYVIAGGENAAGPWTLELRPQTDPGYITNVQLELNSMEGAGIVAGGPFTVSEERPIEQAGGDPVFGAVVKEATGVELRREDGTPPIPAQIVPLPPSMPFGFDLFFASNDADVQATAVAIGVEDPDTSAQGSLPPVTAEPQIVAEGITADRHWALEFSSIPGRNTLVLRDMRDGSILARLEPDSLNRVHTSGLEFVAEAIPGGSVLIFGVAAPAATHLAIALDHGSVTYLQTGDPRWDPLPILTGTGEPGLRLWWAELPIDVGEVVTFSETCDVLARKVFIPDHSVRRPFGDEEMDPRVTCRPGSN